MHAAGPTEAAVHRGNLVLPLAQGLEVVLLCITEMQQDLVKGAKGRNLWPLGKLYCAPV